MNFSKVIMNPPYGKLHLPILKKCVEEFVDIENGGEIVSLQPVRWLQDPLAKYKKNSDALKMQSCLEGRIEDIEIIKSIDAQHCFNLLIPVDIAIFSINKNGKYNYYNNNNILDKILKYDKRIESYIEKNKEGGYRAVIPIIQENCYNRSRGTRIKGNYKTSYSFDGKSINGLNWLEERLIRGVKRRELTNNIPHSIKFNTEFELENFIDSTKTKFFRYLVYEMHRDVNVPNKYLPFMEDYTEPWTDERFYEYFNISPEEQQIIDEALKEDK